MTKELSCSKDRSEEIAALLQELQTVFPVLKAIGDDTRQQILLVLLEDTDRSSGGMRVGEVARRLNLSRPAVSHHVKILMDYKLLSMRREGTRNFYYFNPDRELIRTLISLLCRAENLLPADPA